MPQQAGRPVSGVTAILLAAGRGRRFGSDKRLHPLADGAPMAVHAARALRAACDDVLAVLRPGDEALAAQLAACGCAVVVCADADRGMGHTLAAGVAARPQAAGWLVALADMPRIQPASHRAVLQALAEGASLAAASHQGQRGHPVGFARHWLPQLLALQGDQGARAILQQARDQLRLCPVADAGVLLDVDLPADLDGTDVVP